MARPDISVEVAHLGVRVAELERRVAADRELVLARLAQLEARSADDTRQLLGWIVGLERAVYLVLRHQHRVSVLSDVPGEEVEEMGEIERAYALRPGRDPAPGEVA